MSHPNSRPDLRNPVHLLAFGFGAGCAPKAPGTFGTVVGVILYLPLSLLPLDLYLGLLLIISLIGIPLCGRTARDLGVHDHSGIVWDEIAGYLLTLGVLALATGALPDIHSAQGWLWITLGFIAFRLYDIWKPRPICVADRQVPGGLGIMFDDLLAGLIAGATLALLYPLIP